MIDDNHIQDTTHKKKRKKRKRSRYHDAIFGEDDDHDDIKRELSKTTSAVTQMIASQQLLQIMQRFEDASQKLRSATDPTDVLFYTHMKSNALKMMEKLNDVGDDSDEE